jgi:hypothetical protein
MSQATLSGFVEAMAQTFGIPGVAGGRPGRGTDGDFRPNGPWFHPSPPPDPGAIRAAASPSRYSRPRTPGGSDLPPAQASVPNRITE